MAASDSEGVVQGTTPHPVRRKVENEEIKVGWVNVDDDDAPGWGCLTDQNIKEFLDIQGVPKKRGIKNFNFLTQYLGLQTVLRKVFVLKIKLRACTF